MPTRETKQAHGVPSCRDNQAHPPHGDHASGVDGEAAADGCAAYGREEDAGDMLARVGLRNTRQRRMACAVLQEAEQPLSAETLYLRMRSEDAAVNLSTVYRLLEAFVEKGLVERTGTTDNAKVLYELASHVHHHHLRCLGCQRIAVVEGCPLEAYEKKLERETRFHVTGHRLELIGYCAACMGKRGAHGGPQAFADR